MAAHAGNLQVLDLVLGHLEQIVVEVCLDHVFALFLEPSLWLDLTLTYNAMLALLITIAKWKESGQSRGKEKVLLSR